MGQGLTYGLGIWRHRWLAIAVAWTVALAGWFFVWRMPEAYIASAKIYVDTNTVLRPLLKGLAITPDIDQRVRMMSSTLFSRPNLERLSRMTDLDLDVVTEKDNEQLVNKLRNTISLRGERRNKSVYNIEVTHPERETARRIAQALISVFVESSLSEKRDDSTGAQDFLDDQVQEYEKRLIEAESRLASFKQKNVDVLPSKWGADYYTRLEQVRTELEASRLALQEAQERRDAIQSQIDDGGAGLESLAAAGIMTPTEARIQQMRLRLDDLLTRYTERHPEVRQIMGLMDELEEQRAAEMAGMAAVGGAGGNAVYGDIRTLQSEAEASVAELEVRVAEFERRERALSSKVTQIPEVEAQLKQLDRDYEVILQKHTELLTRRESARLSQGVEDNASDVTFRVIDPPFVPSEPSDPNKTLLNALVLLGALGIGGAVGLLASLIHPVIVDHRSLALVTGLPLLGVVTHNKNREERRRERYATAAFASLTVLLFGVFAGVLFSEQIVGRLL
jgi:polysaccharide chain length determinant protein (PEP-CTERM system associated)